MKKLVLYDSLYGNTAKIAQAVATSISAKALPLAEVRWEDVEKADMLVVGSPTQGGRPTAALQQFLETIPASSLRGKKVAAFDTRLGLADLNWALKLLVTIIGYAAPKLANTLAEKGGELITPPVGFIVKGKEGPLAAGELERSLKWLKL